MKAYPITVLCKVMDVSRSGFYRYLHHKQHPDLDPAQTALEARIKAIFDQHRGEYGSRRIVNQLKDENIMVGRCKVRRIMRKLGLRVKPPKRYKVTTNSRHSYPVAPRGLRNG